MRKVNISVPTTTLAVHTWRLHSVARKPVKLGDRERFCALEFHLLDALTPTRTGDGWNQHEECYSRVAYDSWCATVSLVCGRGVESLLGGQDEVGNCVSSVVFTAAPPPPGGEIGAREPRPTALGAQEAAWDR